MADIRAKFLGDFKEVACDRFGNLAQSSGVGEWKTATIAKDGTVSNAVDLGGNFAYLQVVVPTIDSAALELQAGKEGQNFLDLGQDVTTTAGTGGFTDTWALGGWQFVKIKASATQSTASVQFRVRGVTY